MAKVLFIHPNFPAQFKHLCKNLSARGFKVKFLCQTHNGKHIEGVEKIVIKSQQKEDDGKIITKILETKNQSENSEIYRNVFEKLRGKGWEPDYVISHSGWGCGAYVKSCWPKTTLISYLEWWFNPESEFYSYDEKNMDLRMNRTTARNHWKRNKLLALELASADKIITPSNWQKNQLPEVFKKNTSVIFDGIDTKRFNTQEARRSEEPLITYGTRGMEPVRAFKQFISAIPTILRVRPGIRIEIAGYDEIFYGGVVAEGKNSWGQWAKEYLKEKNSSDRVSWIGYLQEEKYRQWLKKSWCHVYLTHPFVLSWSFVEAYASGCPIVCSNVPPVKEFALKNCILVDHRVEDSICQGIKTILDDETRWNQGKKRDIGLLDHNVAFNRFMHVTGLELATKA